MKNFKLVLLVLAVMVTISCMSFRRGVIVFNSNSKDEVIITNELKALLEEKVKPKVVIRVSNPPANVTEAEKFNTYINSFEKVLIENGFTVRDRALLENLMRGGNTDYQTIREKIDTDIIIDILSLEFNIPNPLKTYLNKTTNQIENFRSPGNYVDCRLAKLECRLTIVSKGQLGGMFTLYLSSCDGVDLEIVVNNELLRWGKTTSPKFYDNLTAPIFNEDIPYFIHNLTQELINLLLKDFNDRLQEARSHYNAGDYTETQSIITNLLAKDPGNCTLYLYQALLDAHRGDFVKANQNLETATQLASVWHQRAMVFYTYARVYALKNEKALALSFLRKGLENGLGKIKLEIRSDKDLASVSSSLEFESLLKEFEKTAAATKK
jgi:tetratricopeptide (TPR) repeat protein